MATVVSGRLAVALAAAVVAIAAIATGFGSSAPSASVVQPADPAGPSTPLRIAYGTAADTFGDLYLPAAGSGRYPVVVLIHGGGWETYSGLSQFAAQSTGLAERGVAVWNIEYRRVGGGGGYPGTLTDVRDAVGALATVVQQRSGNRLDLHRVHLVGHSAGGQLAAWVAARFAPANPAESGSGIRIRSVTLLAAVLDMSRAVRSEHDHFVRTFLGGAPDQVPDRYRFASPIEHIPAGVRITALHGELDQVVATDESRRYVAAATRAGDVADLYVLPGTGHSEFADAASPAWLAARTAILAHIATLR